MGTSKIRGGRALAGGRRRARLESGDRIRPPERKGALDLWPAPGPDFEMMKRLKGLFDPANLLNRGRLYGRI